MSNATILYKVCLKVAYAISATLLILATLSVSSLATDDLPIRPEPGLPERPSIPEETPTSEDGEGIGAHIVLKAEQWDQSLWTLVQWQGASGTWHDVEGWRGQFNQRGQVRWWVDPKDLTKGPFRWIIYRESEPEILWVSSPFNLPMRGEIFEVKAGL